MAVPSYNAPDIPNIGGQIANLGQSVAVQLNQMTENAERRATAARDEQYARLAQQRAIVDAENVARTKEQYNQQKVIEAAGGRDLAAQFMSLSYQLKNAGDDPIAKYTVLQQMDQLTGSGMNSLTNVQRAMMGGIVSQALEKYPQAKQAYDALNTVRYEPVTLGGQTTTLENLPALVQGSSAALAEANRMGNPMLRQMLAQLHPDRFYATGNGTLYSGADAVQGSSLLAQIKTGTKTVDALAEFDRSLETAAVVRQADAAEAQRLGIDISTATNAMAFNYALKHSKAQETMSSSDKASSQQRLDILNNMGEYAQVIAKQGFRVADLTQRHYTTGTDISDLAQQVARIDGVFQQNTDQILALSGNDINKAAQLAELTQVSQKVLNRDGKEVVQSVTDPNRVDALTQAWAKTFIEQDNLGALNIQLDTWSQGRQGKQIAIARQAQLLQSEQITKETYDNTVAYVKSVDDRNITAIGALMELPINSDPKQWEAFATQQKLNAGEARDGGRVLASVNGAQFDAAKLLLDAAITSAMSYSRRVSQSQSLPADVTVDPVTGQPVVTPRETGAQGQAGQAAAVFGESSDAGAKLNITESTEIPASINYNQAAADILGNEGVKTFLSGMYQNVMLAAKDTTEIPNVLDGMISGLVSERGFTQQQAQLLKTVFYQANAKNISSSLLTQRQLFAVQAQEAGAGFSEKVPVYENGQFRMETWTLGENGKISRMVGDESAGADFTMEELTGQVTESIPALADDQVDMALATARDKGISKEQASAHVTQYAILTKDNPDMLNGVSAADFTASQADVTKGLAASKQMGWSGGSVLAKEERDYIAARANAGCCYATDKGTFLSMVDDVGNHILRLEAQYRKRDADVLAKRSDAFNAEMKTRREEIDALKSINTALADALKNDDISGVSLGYSIFGSPVLYVSLGGQKDFEKGSRATAALNAVAQKYKGSLLYAGMGQPPAVSRASLLPQGESLTEDKRIPKSLAVNVPLAYYQYDYSITRDQFIEQLRESFDEIK